jgi:DNA modification methylase
MEPIKPKRTKKVKAVKPEAVYVNPAVIGVADPSGSDGQDRLVCGDCLVEMAKLKDDSIDLLFCDLPYGQTTCHWDCLIDLSQFWEQVNRVCKDTTPMFFTCTTKFGVTLINSNPKNFRYDMVWVKTSACGFLNAKKMPMRKHEMVYVFYRKLPFYDLSSHKHKFLKEPTDMPDTTGMVYGHGDPLKVLHSQYEPSLPISVLREASASLYGTETKKIIHYDENGDKEVGSRYDPPLPTTVVRETLYGNIDIPEYIERKNGEPRYEPSLPTTVLRQSSDAECYDGAITYNYEDRDGAIYDPPLPNTILDIKSEKGHHATQKPTALIEWCLKYYSKEGDTVLDPTMGSGSTGVACKKMNRKFIGIEKDEAIFEAAKKRLN